MRQRAAILTQTPMRLTLGGGGTDVVWYSSLRSGAWISAAIDKYVFVLLNKSTEPKDFENPIIQECLKMAKIRDEIGIYSFSDVTGRSGLGGSGAYEVGLLNALYTYKGEVVSRLDLAKKAADIEIKKLKMPVGPQDQYITALGGINYFEMDKKGQVSVERLELSGETIRQLEDNLLYFSTGLQRDAKVVLGDQKKKSKKHSKESKKIIESLDKIKQLGLLVKDYLKKGQVDDFGRSLHEHWLIKKGLSDKVSNSKIDDWYEEGIRAGALGGKIMGAGGGGWLVFYVPSNKQGFRQRMSKIGLEERKVSFDLEGTKVKFDL